MHEYIEIQFTKKGKPYRVARQVKGGFQFQESDPLTRSIDIGFAAFDDGTKYRMQRIRQIKGWAPGSFDIKVSVEDGSLVLRGADPYSLPEGWYRITANVNGARVKKVDKNRVEVRHDGHGVVAMDLELDERTIDVDLSSVDLNIANVLSASILDGEAGTTWVGNSNIRSTRRACALNLLASLRVVPTKSDSLLNDVDCFFVGRDDRCYARVKQRFYERMVSLSEEHDKVYPEQHPHASIHEELLEAIPTFEAAATGCFDKKGLWSFRYEGRPSLQMVIARPTTAYPMEFADFDLDLGNPLQDVVGLVVHIGELLDGKPTNHLDLGGRLLKNKAIAPYMYYTVRRASA